MNFKKVIFLFFNKAVLKAALLLSGLFYIGCSHLQDIDHSYVNQPVANLKTSIHTTNSPMTGLRTLSTGGVSCSNCAK